MTQLTERKKADRERMAQMVEALCAEFGAKCERSEYHSPREIRLDIEFQEVGCGIDFDGDNCAALLDNYCLPWCVSFKSERRLSKAFGYSQFAEVNPFHRRKCTAFAEGIDNLLDNLALGFEMLADGTGFEPSEEIAA